MKDNRALQEKYQEFQMIDQHMKQLSQEIQELANKLIELEYIKKSLDELKGFKKGSEILAPISSGIFVKASLQDNEKLLVNVGSNTVVVKNIDDTKKLMDDQVGEVEKLRDQYIDQLSKYSVRARMLEAELQKLAKEA